MAESNSPSSFILFSAKKQIFVCYLYCNYNLGVNQDLQYLSNTVG